MSHLSHLKTSFQKLIYLEKALTKLNIPFKHTVSGAQRNLIIPQSNQYDLEFVWNRDSYEFVVDRSFWAQRYPIEIFLEKVAQEYSTENLVRESQKLGFQLINFQNNLEGTKELLIERWKY
jgi:hypothetical protein